MNKRIAFIFIGAVAIGSQLHAQSYTEHLQSQQNGNGTVTVNQSKELESLINGTSTGTTTAKPSAPKPSTKPSTTNNNATPSGTTHHDNPAATPSHSSNSGSSTGSSSTRRNTEESNKNVVKRDKERDKTEETTTHASTGKKVMKGTRKVTGYRIQVFSGGNSRKDREQAQQIGNRIKAAMPSYPIFVHFYSPSWKCRVGNFVDIKDAESALRRIRNLGYRQAVIVKGKISVQ